MHIGCWKSTFLENFLWVLETNILHEVAEHLFIPHTSGNFIYRCHQRPLRGKVHENSLFFIINNHIIHYTFKNFHISFFFYTMEKNHAESTADETSILYNNWPVLKLFTSPKHIMMVTFISLLQKRITGRNKLLQTFSFLQPLILLLK